MQQFIEGKNLAEDLQDEGLYGEREIIDLLTKLLPVLKFVHQRQIIHRDVKPENIIRCNNDRLVLVDFGASKYLTSPILKTGTVIGTAGYVSPEQAVGKPVFSSDLYSLGVTCVHLMTGIEPFQLYDASEGEWVWRDYLTQSVNNSLGQILDKMLEPAKRRFQSADEVLQALNSGLTVVRKQQSEQQPESIPLKSTTGVDYTKLRDLLKAGKWQEADLETRLNILRAVHKEKDRKLIADDLRQFPCSDLCIIDQLWQKYSDGHFGLGVQKRIWEGTNRNYNRLVKLLGWIGFMEGGKEYNKLTFSLKAPKGHLPAVAPFLYLPLKGFPHTNICNLLYLRYLDCGL